VNLDIGVAYSSEPHTDERPALPQLRKRFFLGYKFVAMNMEREHSIFFNP
jgi:hypothetical protein